MWIKVKFVDTNEKTIVLPLEIAKTLNNPVQLIFGSRHIKVNVLYYRKLLYNEKSSFEEPISILLSSDLKSHLLIPDTQIYRAKINESTISLGPVIALLLGVRSNGYSPNYMRKYTDRLGIYNKVGGLIYAFSPNSVIWDENKVHGLYFNIKTSKWEYDVFPLPNVIYRRNFHQPQNMIDSLKESTHGNLFNSYRFSKLELFKIIEKQGKLAQKLPMTEKIESFEKLKDFTDKYKKAILKPNSLSRGRGICILEKKEDSYIISDYRGRDPFDIVLEGESEFLKFYLKNTEFHNDYLVQQHLRLAKVKDSVFDIRVVMQKKTRNTWDISGIECRVSNPKNLITNISRGGYPLKLDQALWAAFKDENVVLSLTKKIYEYCQDLCAHLDSTGEHFAEFGLDIGVDEDQEIWLIEANVFPSFKGFKQMEYDTYLKIRYAPLLYALSLTEFATGAKEAS